MDDLILLTDKSEEAVIRSLADRLNHGKIYTYIGNVIIAINPYRKINNTIDETTLIKSYQNRNIYEIAPHIYGLADNAYREMRLTMKDQCVIISGESGAGKTEASKILMKYIASVSANQKNFNTIKDQLLNSNPCLEAFGNAKTNKNDNSSRFGKYMDLQFDFNGTPVAGKITTYLLEKSRIVHIPKGERSFHIFYQLLKGAKKELLDKLFLTSDISKYNYLSSDIHCQSIIGTDDSENFQSLLVAFSQTGIQQDKIDILFQSISAILNLGNITFTNDPETNLASTTSTTEISNVASLLGVTPESLLASLTIRKIKDPSNQNPSLSNMITMPLSSDQACLSRDALAKSLYGKTFLCLVGLVNGQLHQKRNSILKASCNVIGVLDIYGFEIMQVNGFEQFVINYCNEKLQQLFIELVLKSEQEEYAKEGIEWKEIKFFNNKTICDLIESKNAGIISLLDESCVMPGNPTDISFLDKCNQNAPFKHAHYDSKQKTPKEKSLVHGTFRLKHYAGDVDYTVDGFIQKNKDTFFNDLQTMLNGSTKKHIRDLFKDAHNIKDDEKLKRPETLAAQFKTSMGLLMDNLLSKNPHYIRCIKPNNFKTPDQWDENLVSHQVRYLGLSENIRVRCAGFCYRETFKNFIFRYKMLSKKTWPNPSTTISLKDSVVCILEEAGIGLTEYQFGRNKIFLKMPKTVHCLEEKRAQSKHVLTTKIRAKWLAYLERRKYLEKKRVLILVQASVRRHQKRVSYLKQQKAVTVISKIQKGRKCRAAYRKILFKTPKHAAIFIQRYYRRRISKQFLAVLIQTAKKTSDNAWNTISWPIVSNDKRSTRNFVYPYLKVLYSKMMAKKYRKSLTPERKEYIIWKSAALNLFKSKESYHESFLSKYEIDHFGISTETTPKFEKLGLNPTLFISLIPCFKLHRHSLNKEKPSLLALTKTHLHLIETPLSSSSTFELKQTTPLSSIKQISMSTLTDGIMVFRTSPAPPQSDKKGDLVLRSDGFCIEFCARLWCAMEVKAVVVVDCKVDLRFFDKCSELLFSLDDVEKLSIKQYSKNWVVSIPKTQSNRIL